MNGEWISGSLPGKKYLKATHASGLQIYLYPMPGFSSNYAMFGTKYGSIDNEYTAPTGERVQLPEGIAHFLEHKLFESEEGDAFESYAKTGAYANAYTSFDRTCYLFSCANRFYENLKILLNFVRTPYFTAKTVAKEQGIIGQEIRMYRDMPSWRVLINMLEGMFHHHPVKIDIPGTEQTIAEITDKLLYGCYEKFYNLSNMFLILAGDFDPQQVLDFIEKNLKSCPPQTVQKSLPDEPQTVVTHQTELKMQVYKPLFCLGFKQPFTGSRISVQQAIYTALLLKVLVGPASPLYRTLLEKGLINEEFGVEHFTGRGFAVPMLEGESNNPEQVRQLFLQEVQRLRREGINERLFNAVKREAYGKGLVRFDSAEGVCAMLCDAVVEEYSLFEYFKVLHAATVQNAEEILSVFCEENAVLSVIRPLDANA